MKLFYFNPNTYGEQAFVCADSVELAKIALSNELVKIDEKVKPRWDPVSDKNNLINKMINQLDGYTIEEIEPMTVIWAEIS